MKKIINRKLYDTSKATKLCEYSYSNRSDYRHYSEALYKTKSGTIFLYGIGGPASRYAIQVGNNEYSGSSDIQVMEINEILQWLEDNSSYINLDDKLIQELNILYIECV